jgi:hypothetical protein
MSIAALGLVALPLLQSGAPASSHARELFTIEIVDAASGRGVPLVELRAVDGSSWWSDSQGIVALDEPGLLDVDCFFHVQSPGYELPADGFGNRGVKLRPSRGGSATIRLTRLQIAERLYRFTGAGIDRDSVLAGRPVPIRQPLLNGQVTGQDTVVTALYRGRIHWFFGDTNQVAYPLGNFAVSGAVSLPPDRGGLDPAVGVDLDYFVGESGFSRPMVALPGPGAHWIEGPLVVPDEHGTPRLAARVATHVDLGPAKCWHLVVFDDAKSLFEPVKKWDWHEGHDSAHPFHAMVDGVDYAYLFPNLRVKSELKRLENLDEYEALTCVSGDGKVHGPVHGNAHVSDTKIERDAAGRALYRWIGGADRLSPARVAELIAAGVMKREDGWDELRDFERGTPIGASRGSVFWNVYHQRWLMLCAAATPGEIWFAEADTPVGPWGYARRVATHGPFNFYNPTQELLFDQECGRKIYFAGTYTTSFSAAKVATPRYDYNELMYRLNLDDPRLQLPIALYRVRGADGGERLLRRDQVEAANAWERIEEVACFALPPTFQRETAVPIYASGETESGGATRLSLASAKAGDPPRCFGVPLELSAGTESASEWRSPALVPLNEYRRTADGGACYSTASSPPPGCEPVGRSLCRVWRAPTTALVLDWKAQPVAPLER